MSEKEIRLRPGSVELVEVRGSSEESYLAGYAAVFFREGDPGTEFELAPEVKERVDPGAFSRSLKDGDDVVGVFNHNPENLLGRRSSGTLKLSVDKIGLRYRIDLPETSLGQDVREMVRRGDVTGSSFAFRIRGEEWITNDDGSEIRLLKDVELFDVGPVVWPAYDATTTGVSRSEVCELAMRSRPQKGCSAQDRGKELRSNQWEMIQP